MLVRVRPVVRLMSDRESVSGVSKPRLGFDSQVRAPKSDSEGSEALCVLIRILFVLLKERTRFWILCCAEDD